jgi:hypothetical protein
MVAQGTTMLVAEDVIVDVPELVRDLKLAVAYAARAGLLRDKSLLITLESAEKATSANNETDIHALTFALNEIIKVISPMTLADLKFGRDPFERRNQITSRRLQFCLTLFALVILILIASFMQSLRQEQSAIAILQEVVNLRPQEKAISLRKLAQWEKPLHTRSTLYDQYHEKVDELLRIKDRIQSSHTQAREAVEIPLFPPARYFRRDTAAASATQNGELSKDSRSESSTDGIAVTEPSGDGQSMAAKSPSSTTPDKADQAIETDTCLDDSNGGIRLPSEASKYPDWMQQIVLDNASDFCFQLNVLSQGDKSAVVNWSFTAFAAGAISKLKDKVSLRVEWFLPFLYGLLGSAVFMMRNIASIRTPGMEWLPVLMRVSLGGVAGIVIGWFAAAMPQGGAKEATFLPFGLAFLTGYGIDVLFNLLDKLNQAVGESSRRS